MLHIFQVKEKLKYRTCLWCNKKEIAVNKLCHTHMHGSIYNFVTIA